MQAEERKIEQITAESDDAWDMVKQLKQARSSRGKQQVDLTNAEARNFINYWQGLYQREDPPELEHEEGIPISALPTREEIELTIRQLPNKKAPGPDGIAAEMIKQ